MSTRFQFDFGKYRGILISVALFLLLDASVLMLNFYVSFEIADDAVGVNLAGRQRMLSQRMAKSLLVLDSSRDDPTAFQAAYDELLLSKSLFDETLKAFSQGGSVRGAGKEMVMLDAVENRAGRDALHNTEQLWRPYKLAVDNFIASRSANTSELTGDSQAALAAAVAMARLHNLPILASMNELTLSLEQVAASKAKRLRLIQTIGISLAVINFLFILLHFIRQLRDSDAVIEKARRETNEILQTVNEGLFLIDQQLIIGDQHSAKLSEVLGSQTFAGKSFQTLLENMISEKDAETARGFIELLFDPKIKEKLIGDLNPLNLVEVNIAQANGGFLTKHLQFTFARAYQEREISHVLVTVLDISEQVKLARELNESRKHNESQLEMITSLLHTHPELLKEFIHNSFQCFNRINSILRQPAKNTTAVRDKAINIFREIHNFKGEAASLKLEFFENAAHVMEDTLAQLRTKPELGGNDYLGFTVQLENLINYTQQVQLLTEKLGQFALVANPSPRVLPNHVVTGNRRSDGWDHLQDFVQNLALRNGKQLRLVTSGLREIDLASECEQQLKEICIQLLRNAVVHGIETPEERRLSEKSPTGRIDLRLAKLSDSEMELTVSDDGKGLDYQAIRAKALGSGKWSEQEIESWSNKQLLGLIFQAGFSTAQEVSKDAGRGMGMEAVMQHVVGQRGKITVASRAGEFCRFVISLPIIPRATEIPTSVTKGTTYAVTDDC
uniref:ATP-binding protein n=1 Tax=Cellvibrio fontiphilus TaxID=1815559 RepID=UPI002B4BB657|nr:ATP-binding protein [Cellvibrio fontiphilus]